MTIIEHLKTQNKKLNESNIKIIPLDDDNPVYIREYYDEKEKDHVLTIEQTIERNDGTKYNSTWAYPFKALYRNNTVDEISIIDNCGNVVWKNIK